MATKAPSFQVIGKIVKIYDAEQRSEKFSSRDFVIEIPDGEYPQLAKFQLAQARCTLIDSYQVGQTVSVEFDIRGREWQGKYFTNLNAWKIQPVQGNDGIMGSVKVAPMPPPSAAVQAAADMLGGKVIPTDSMPPDDLPF